MFAAMVFDIAVVWVTHVNEEVITTWTISPVISVFVEKTALFPPTFPPFTFHWYDGLPPLTGVAVKTMPAPSHCPFVPVLMLTDGVTVGLTVMVTEFEFTVTGLAQEMEEVMVTETTSPFTNEFDS